MEAIKTIIRVRPLVVAPERIAVASLCEPQSNLASKVIHDDDVRSVVGVTGTDVANILIRRRERQEGKSCQSKGFHDW